MRGLAKSCLLALGVGLLLIIFANVPEKKEIIYRFFGAMTIFAIGGIITAILSLKKKKKKSKEEKQ